MRILIPLVLILALAACVGPPEQQSAPVYHHPAPHRPMGAHPNADVAQCEAHLNANGAEFTPLTDQYFSAGCSAVGAVQLYDIAPGVPITNTKALKCEVALPLSQWVEGPVQAAAQRWFGQSVIKVESMGTYGCRNVIGNAYSANKLSEHARADAVDIGGFVLSDGRRITVLNGWHGPEDEQGFLHQVHDAACQRFITVLSPDYNTAHANHLHFDMGGSQFCR